MNTNSTPREIDEALAALWHRRADAQIALEHDHNHAHSLLGERRAYVSKTERAWPSTHAQAVAGVAAALAALDAHYAQTGQWTGTTGPIAPHELAGARRVLDRIEAREGELAQLDKEIDELEDEYSRRPWQRFFLVTSSVGHIHRSRRCTTCRPTTTYGWLPALSGQTEAQAVAAHGPALCSVCFPTAPAEHQGGRITKAQAVKIAA